MKAKSFFKPVILIVIAGLAATGCVERVRYVRTPPPPPAEVVVSGEPPAPIVEVQPVAPGPEFFWVGGAWVWEGRWVWHGGHWGRRPHPNAVWVPGYYTFRGGRHVYIRGYWR